MMFQGFDDWIEIFRGGMQTDSQGREHDGDEVIENALKNFDPQNHEPPVVIGHPEDNAPAFGWVSEIKKATKNGVAVLVAKLRQVAPEFAKMIEEGRFKKRSASFYPDGTLRHVGFLGAAPPAIKGLADLKFESNDNSILFEEEVTITNAPATGEQGGKKMDLNGIVEFLKFWESAKPTVPVTQPVASDNGNEKSFSEADVERMKREAAEKARKEAEEKAAAEFAEKERQVKREARRKEISEKVGLMVEAGKIPPAFRDMGLAGFLHSLGDKPVFEFADNGEKRSQQDWMMSFLEKLPEVMDFKAFATKNRAANPGGNESAGHKLNQLAWNLMAQNKNMNYRDALEAVTRENPELAAEYRQEV